MSKIPLPENESRLALKRWLFPKKESSQRPNSIQFPGKKAVLVGNFSPYKEKYARQNGSSPKLGFEITAK